MDANTCSTCTCVLHVHVHACAIDQCHAIVMHVKGKSRDLVGTGT